MSRIDKVFRALTLEGKKAFIPYITAGDPDIRTTGKIVLALERAGADIIELGIPFSDPLADGPVIQQASYRALCKGASLRKAFAMVERLRLKTEIPLVFMTYYNVILKYGVPDFMASCSGAGVDGVIVPDLPYDEARELIALGRKHRISTIFLAAPTSTSDRLLKIAENSRGFIYYVSLTGVTGARRDLPPEVVSNVRMIKSITDKPVAVGFGISNVEQARRIAKVADGVIVGSAIVKIISQGGNALPRVERFARSLAKAIHGV